MFNDKNYYEVTKAFPSVVEKLKSMNHTSAILYYVQSVGLISQLNCFSKCLQGFGPELDFPIPPEISNAQEYAGYLLAVAEASASGSCLINDSDGLEWYCYRSAVEAGSNRARNILIERMLFGKVDSSGKVVSAPRCIKEALEQIKSYIPTDGVGEDAGYLGVIKLLKECLAENSRDQKVALIECLMKDARSEVRCLAPMLLLEPMFGQVDSSLARDYIAKLKLEKDASIVLEYWQCLVDLLENKNKAVTIKKLLELGEQGFLEAYLLLLKSYQYQHDFLEVQWVIDIYRKCGDFTPELACLMFRLS